jgi:hypothetical protein
MKISFLVRASMPEMYVSGHLPETLSFCDAAALNVQDSPPPSISR